MNIPPPGIGAVAGVSERLSALIKSNHVRPYLEDIGGMGKIHHVRSEAPGRTHIDFEAYIISLFPKSFPVAVKLEILEMDEPAGHSEGLYCPSADLGKPLNYGVLPDGLPDSDELCIVVLGFQLNPDGTMKEELVERLTAALNSAKKYPRAYVVCTGGGTASENESASEAGEMAKWLAENGIDPARIIVEDNSLTTAQNAMFSIDILSEKYPQVTKLAIVSSDYHIATGNLLFGARSILLAEKAGEEKYEVISNAAYKASTGSLSTTFQAVALSDLSRTD